MPGLAPHAARRELSTPGDYDCPECCTHIMSFYICTECHTQQMCPRCGHCEECAPTGEIDTAEQRNLVSFSAMRRREPHW